MTENVYKAPESELIGDSPNEAELASRWSRLGAAIIDAIIMMLITLPVMYFTGGFENIADGVQPSAIYGASIAFIGIIAFALINWNSLVKNGQTIGKKVVGIKIVTLDGLLPTMKSHLLKRYGVYFIPGQIPFVGQFFSIVNILFIFGKQKRCIHDLVAGTKVVKGE